MRVRRRARHPLRPRVQIAPCRSGGSCPGRPPQREAPSQPVRAPAAPSGAAVGPRPALPFRPRKGQGPSAPSAPSSGRPMPSRMRTAGCIDGRLR